MTKESKQYEYKAVQAEMVMVDFDTQVSKRAGGSYDGTNIMFKAFGKVNEKGFTTKTYEFKPELRAQLEAVNKKGTLFTLNYFREAGGQFWNINDVQEGHVAKDASPSGNAQAQGSASSFSGGSPQGFEVGQLLNIMVEQTGGDFNKILDANFVREQIVNFKRSRELIEKLWDASDKEPTPRVQENMDGDIPF